MLKRRPPLTTFETRLTFTTVSSRFSFEASILGIFSPSSALCRERGCCASRQGRLKLQACFTGAFGERGHTPMIGIAAAIKDHLLDPLLLRALSHQLADLAGEGDLVVVRDRGQRLYGGLLLALLRGGEDCFGLGWRAALGLSPGGSGLGCLLRPGPLLRGGRLGCDLDLFKLHRALLLLRSGLRGGLEILQRLFQRRGGGQGAPGCIVDHLGIDLTAAAENAQARALRAAMDAIAHAQVPLQASFICVELLDHFFLPPTFPALPALRRIASPA